MFVEHVIFSTTFSEQNNLRNSVSEPPGAIHHTLTITTDHIPYLTPCFIRSNFQSYHNRAVLTLEFVSMAHKLLVFGLNIYLNKMVNYIWCLTKKVNFNTKSHLRERKKSINSLNINSRWL